MASSRAGAGVAPQEREQVVAEVESHVTDTGEGPVDAFGPPGVYAAQYPEGPARLDGNATRPCPHLVVPHLVVPHLVVPHLVVPPAIVSVSSKDPGRNTHDLGGERGVSGGRAGSAGR